MIDATELVRISVDDAAGHSFLWLPSEGWAEETPSTPPARMYGLDIDWTS